MHPKPVTRRRHSDEVKAKVLAACDAPGASISGVALAHGLNANLVRKWRSGRCAKVAGTAIMLTASNKAVPAAHATAEFVALEMPEPPKASAPTAASPTAVTPTADAPIQIELRRGALHVNVCWPVAAADDCRAWLRDLTSGLVK